MRDKLQHPNIYRATLLELGYWNFSGAWRLEFGAFALKLCFLVANHEMDHAIRRGNEEPVEIFP